MKKTTSIIYLLMLSVLTSCGAYFNQPFTQTKARIGENTSPEFLAKSFLPSFIELNSRPIVKSNVPKG